MTNNTDTQILDCGHTPTEPHSSITNGIAYAQDGRSMCYACADREQRERVTTDDKIFGYVSGDERAITTWTGGELMKVTEMGKSRSGWYSSEIFYIRATAPDGSHWYGKNGGSGMCITMKRAKS